MEKSWSSTNLKILMIICVIIVFTGSITIFRILQLRDDVTRIEAQPHPLAQVPPATELPESEVRWINVEGLSLRIYLWVYTYHYHNGNKGTSGSLDISIMNDGNTTLRICGS